MDSHLFHSIMYVLRDLVLLYNIVLTSVLFSPLVQSVCDLIWLHIIWCLDNLDNIHLTVSWSRCSYRISADALTLILGSDMLATSLGNSSGEWFCLSLQCWSNNLTSFFYSFCSYSMYVTFFCLHSIMLIFFFSILSGLTGCMSLFLGSKILFWCLQYPANHSSIWQKGTVCDLCWSAHISIGDLSDCSLIW